MSFVRIAARWLEKNTVKPLATVVGTVTGITFLGMVIVVIADVTGRRFGIPILGTYEIVSYLLVITFFLGMCYTGTQKFHHAVEMLSEHFPRRTRFIIRTFMHLVSALVCGLICSMTIVYAQDERASGVTGYLLTSVPVYPFIFIAALGLAIQSWLFLVQSISDLDRALTREM